MARYIGPKYRLSRREGVDLFLKGGVEKAAEKKRMYPPGQHGMARRRRVSEYARQLREKQKVKRIYGLLEKQFAGYFRKAKRARGETGKLLLQLLERRLDNVVFRLGWAPSRFAARQFVGQGKIAVRGKIVRAPSYCLKKEDKLEFARGDFSPREDVLVPPWLRPAKDKKSAVVSDLPPREAIDQDIDESLIVEYYLK